ncbi:hypothetical protein HPP92_018209 [Vanilla planifolia]|uniref:Uncharacterized protein n=1 Tax=Vanilla planifolia TaxID=51239 RepID=A0A835URB5_VANPL|nr:hypothetical protein HPP92_018798 [Vanilla planifolia]KAG0468881.1 hypothetical protein HPP92_018209 [Vanilla planifolia]
MNSMRTVMSNKMRNRWLLNCLFSQKLTREPVGRCRCIGIKIVISTETGAAAGTTEGCASAQCGRSCDAKSSSGRAKAVRQQKLLRLCILDGGGPHAGEFAVWPSIDVNGLWRRRK